MSWDLTGNAGTDPSTNFIGTTDGKDLVLSVNSSEIMRLQESLSVVNIGINDNTAPLDPYLALVGSAPSTYVTYRSLSNNSPIIFTVSPTHGGVTSTDDSIKGIDFVDMNDGDVAIYECTVTAICTSAGGGVSVGDTLARKKIATFHRTGSTVSIDSQQTDFSYTSSSMSSCSVSLDAFSNQLQLNVKGINGASIAWASESKWTKHGA